MKLVNAGKTRYFAKHKDGAIVLRCPHCRTALLEQSAEEGESTNICSHVLFRWDSAKAIEFFGNWCHATFEKTFLELLAKTDGIHQCRADHEGDEPGLPDYFLSSEIIAEILEQLQDDSIDEVLYLSYVQEYHLGGGGAAAVMWGMCAPKIPEGDK